MTHSITEMQQTVRASGRRVTPQRRLILKVLRESNEHLAAEELHQRVRALDAEISLATVYRTLAVLRKLGLVNGERLGQDHSHYEAVRETPHYHFTCSRCGDVIEFETGAAEHIIRQLIEGHGVQVSDLEIEAHGLCARCREQADG